MLPACPLRALQRSHGRPATGRAQPAPALQQLTQLRVAQPGPRVQEGLRPAPGQGPRVRCPSVPCLVSGLTTARVCRMLLVSRLAVAGFGLIAGGLCCMLYAVRALCCKLPDQHTQTNPTWEPLVCLAMWLPSAAQQSGSQPSPTRQAKTRGDHIISHKTSDRGHHSDCGHDVQVDISSNLLFLIVGARSRQLSWRTAHRPRTHAHLKRVWPSVSTSACEPAPWTPAGLLVSSAVPALSMMLFWRRIPAGACIASTLGGQACAIIAWIVHTQIKYAPITVSSARPSHAHPLLLRLPCLPDPHCRCASGLQNLGPTLDGTIGAPASVLLWAAAAGCHGQRLRMAAACAGAEAAAACPTAACVHVTAASLGCAVWLCLCSAPGLLMP